MSELNDVLFGDTVTLYNHYRENREDRWQRTVIRGVQHRAKTEKTVDASGLHLAQSVSVTIPVNADAGGRHYLPPHLFATSENRAAYWTLDSEQNLDVIVNGECAEELSVTYTLDHLRKERRYATIKGVSDNTGRPRLKHWKVTAV
ncbi:MAG: hypothetical protein GX418_04420 [Clostridiales bacterium]|nr:hypothetical protein [Clostridiales bacterium]